MFILKMILNFVGGSVLGQLTKAYEIKKAAEGQTQNLVADALVKDAEAKMEGRQQATQIRRETAGFWEMRLITFVIAACFTSHLVLVTLDTNWGLFGGNVSAFPSPFDEWEGKILLSFFGLQVAGHAINAISGAIRGRRG